MSNETRHLAFLSAPAHGHVNPTLPLVMELTRRGHRVSYAVTEDFGTQVRGAGAELVAVHSSMPRSAPPGTDFGPDRVAMFMGHLLDDAETNLPALVRHFQADPPDAVCYDMMAKVGPILAGRLGVPAVQLLPSLASNAHFSLFAQAAGGFDREHPDLVAVGRRWAEFARSQDIESPDIEAGGASLLAPGAEELNLVFLPRAFQPAGDTFDDRFVFTGPALGGREDSPEWQSPPPGTRLLFISLGTAMNNRPDFFRLCVEAFADGPWRVAMAIGEQVDPADLGPVPASFDVRPYFPQPAVLRDAAAFVTHAGMNSTMEALCLRVPLIAVPQMPEQAANARRIEELGLGRRLTDLTVEGLRAAVRAVVDDPTVRAGLLAMREEIENAGGPPAGADALERHLSRRPAAARTR